MIKSLREDVNKYLKEIFKNPIKQMKEMNKSLNEIQENTSKQRKEMNKTAPRTESRNRNNEENTNWGNPGDGIHGEETCNNRHKYHLQNKRDRRKSQV